MKYFDLSVIHESWKPIFNSALQQMDTNYIQKLQHSDNWLPGKHKIFNAFSIPLASTQHILFGESPYPRQASANGFAFWDAAVGNLWSSTGLSKPVNKATSLRNIMKMLLFADAAVSSPNCTQAEILQLDKQNYVQTIDELFANFVKHGILLLNTSLVLSNQPVKKDAACWRPFMTTLLDELARYNPKISLILLGNIAKSIDSIKSSTKFPKLYAPHPYNISFIQNQAILAFFKPLHLLRKNKVY